MFRITLRVVGSIQILLGLAYLLAPRLLLLKMGHSQPAPDLLYPLGMLAARFLAYGAGLWLASTAPDEHVLWIRLMAVIQVIDLMVGMFYTATGVVPLSLSAFPMFNAVWIAALCYGWRPAHARTPPVVAP
jgi:hypothetical protein